MKKLLPAILALAIFASCNKTENETDTLDISAPSEIVFNADGTGEHSEITVTTDAAEWSYEMAPEDGNGWLTADRLENKLTLAATPRTESTAPAAVTITFRAGNAPVKTVTATQLPASPQVSALYEFSLANVAIVAVSENGRYVTGYNSDGGFVLDVTKLRHDEEGLTVLEEGYAVPVYTPEQNPELIFDYTFLMQAVDNEGTPYPMSVTPDGSTMVGFTGSPFEGGVQPCLFIDGTEKLLPIPDSYYVVDEDYYGAYAAYISADANLVVGEMQTYAPQVAVYWTKNAAGEYEWHEIAADMIETEPNGEYIDLTVYPELSFPASGASVNGKYTFGALITTTAEALITDADSRPYILDVETGELTFVPDHNNAIPSAVSDDGTLFFFEYDSDAGEIPYVFKNGSTKIFKEWVKENYDLDIAANVGTVQTVSKDRKVIAWYEMTMDGFVNHIIVVE